MVNARNQNVVKVNKNEGQTSQDGVHHALERGAGVAQTKRHVEELKEAEGYDNGGLGTYRPGSTP